MDERLHPLLRSLHVLHEDGEIVEIRRLSPTVLSGYFRVGDDDERLLKLLTSHERDCLYQTMNVIDPALYARQQSGRLIEKPKETTADANIGIIRWILIDCDPVRASGISATDAQKESARQTSHAVYDYLRKKGFAEPVVCDSGNGYHLLYRVEALGESSAVVTKFLKSMDVLFSDDKVKIDTKVGNPARITKLYGCISSKGANTQERPHRRSGILYMPQSIEKTSITLIGQIADNVMPKGTVEARPSRHAAGCFDAQSFLVEHGVRFQVHDGAGYRKLVLEECPFDASHKAPDAAVLVFDNGRIGFNCFHNGCANRTWRDVRQHYDPTAYERAAYVSSCEQVRKAEATSDGDLEESGLLDITKIPFEDRSKTLYVRTGIPELNRMLGGADCGFAKGEVTVWTGANGSGKSTLISQMALESAAEGYHVAIFTGELSPGRAKAWLYLQAAGHDGVYRDGDSDFWSVEDTMKLAISRALEGRVFIYPNEKGTAVDAVLGRIQKHMKDHPVDVIILDNMMVLDKGDGMDKYDAQLRIMKAVVEFTRVNNVHVHFVCHPRKQSGLISRYDISGTADISNLAANIIAVYRNGDEFRAAWAQSKQGEVAPNSDNLLQLLKCRSDGEHVGEILPLYFDTCCKVMSAARGGRRNYPWQEGVKPEQMLIDVSGMADPDFPFVDGGAQ